MDVSGRGVFLTGGAQGIGRAVTTALLEKGARVLFCDVNPEVGKATEEELQKRYGKDNVAFARCDVTDADQLKAAFEAAVKKFGAVEICANNAGIMDEIVWEKMLAINTTAQIRGSQIALEHMRRDKGGRGGVIINTVSIAGLIRAHWLPVYMASKHAMIGYTTSCASDPDMPALGVRWCCLCPVPVNTPMLDLKEGQVKNPADFLQRMDPAKIQPLRQKTMDVSGRGVFLTGGAQGIGRAVTAALLEKGARVLFCDINAEVGKATEQELQKQYGADNVAFAHCDVTNTDHLKATFETAVSRFGAVEIISNNAGFVDERTWEKTIAVNLVAQMHGSQIALEHMRRDKGGRGGVIINTVSEGGLVRNYYMPVYTASKHAMVGYTSSRASDPDMPALGVRWCCLCPSPVKTPIWDFEGGQVKNGEELHGIVEPIMIQPEDVAKAFLQLVEDVDNNGKIMVVSKRGAVYRKRITVDEDGVSNPREADRPLTKHPPVPGQSL